MRTLIISDIHGNMAALEAVAAEPHDDVICLGDIVGYGPDPSACLEWVREHASIVVLGNHDLAAADGGPPHCRPEFERLADAVATATRSRLRRSDRDCLGALPRWSFFSRSRVAFLCLHATPRNPLYRYLANDLAGWMHELAGVDADIVLVGHTHLPFALTVGRKRVVNPGSVGQPKDGDPRASYAVLDDGTITFKRAAYSVARTVDGVKGLHLPNDVLAPLVNLLRTGTVGAPAGDAGRAPTRVQRSAAGDGAPELQCAPSLPGQDDQGRRRALG